MTSRHLLLTALLMLAPLAATHAQTEAPGPLPAGTEIMVRTIDPMSSMTATTGQKFKIEVDADVVVDGLIVLPAGTHGVGTVVFARKKGMSGRPGALDLRIDSIEGPNGPIKLRANETNRGTDKRRSGVAAAMVFGLIGAAAVQGTDISVPAGSLIPTLVVVPHPASGAASAPVLAEPGTQTKFSPQASVPQASDATTPSDPAPKDQP